MKYLGRAEIAYDGKKLDTLPGASIDLGGIIRKPVQGSHRIGHAEELKAASVECEILISADTDEEDIRQIVDATVTFRADTGQTWMIRNAFVEDSLKITSGEGGKTALKLTGDPAERA